MPGPNGEQTNPHGVRYLGKTNGAEEAVESAVTESSWWKGMPLWVKGVAFLVLGTSGAGGVVALFPWESKDAAAAAHEKLQTQIDAMRKELPPAVADEIDRRAEAKAEAARLRRHR